MVQDREAVDRVKAVIAEEDVDFINLQFTDIVGIVKNVTIPVERFDDAVNYGVWFDGSSIEGFARIAESDMYLIPDLDTFAVIPWERGERTTARVICNVYTPEGEPFPGDPRAVLRRALREAEEMGFIYNTGPEPEFFLFGRDEHGEPIPAPHDDAGYFDVSTDLAHDIRRQMANGLQAFGIEVETMHHEVAVGQHEIDFEYSNALRSADDLVTLRVALKAIAQRNDLYATFMPKPIARINGSGMHTHQSLMYRGDTGENAFVDAEDAYGLSEVARQFVAGQLEHARGMCAVLAPLVNSYKRLVPGYEAPVYVSWARINRSALIRVPKVSPGKLESTRLELRCLDPSCNPYLAFAVMLRAGLDGIKRGLTPPEPAEENLYHLDQARMRERRLATLPGSLGAALAEMEEDGLVREALGDHVYERFLEAKMLEWDDYRLEVTRWELDRYLAIY